MKRSAFARPLRARLVARASPTVRAGAERYFKHQVRFLHPKGWSYFDTLRKKLKWNEG